MVLEAMTGQKRIEEIEISKYEKAIEDLLQYIMTDLKVEGKSLPFTLADYFCVTSVKPNELLAYIRRYKANMEPLYRRVLCMYLGKNLDLGTSMTRERVASEKLAYIIDGEEKAVTQEMWEEIFTTYEENNIPTNRNVKNLIRNTFVAWKVYTSQQTSGTITSVSFAALPTMFTKSPSAYSDGTFNKVENAGEVPDWNSDSEGFNWRYTSDVWVYAFFRANLYTINYYGPTSNTHTSDGYDVAKPASRKSFSSLGSSSVYFNNLLGWDATGVDVKINQIALTGYYFVGWKVYVNNNDSNVALDTPTVCYRESLDQLGIISSDSSLTSSYMQDFTLHSSNFYYRYTSTIYAYAVFERTQTIVHYYNSLYDYFDNTNNNYYYKSN